MTKQARSAVEARIGEIYPAAPDHPTQDCLVVLLAMPEANGTEGHRREKFEIGTIVDLAGQRPGVCKVLRDGGAKGATAMILQGHPELQGTKPAGKLDRFIEKGEGFDRIVIEHTDIVGLLGEGPARRIPVPVEQASAIGGLIEPFMSVDRYRVGERQPLECLGFRESRQAPIGAVDVQPKAFFIRDGGNLLDRIDRPANDGSRRGNDRDRPSARCSVASYGATQGVRPQAKHFVRFDRPEILPAESQQGHGLGNREMDLLGTVDGAAFATLLV